MSLPVLQVLFRKWFWFEPWKCDINIEKTQSLSCQVNTTHTKLFASSQMKLCMQHIIGKCRTKYGIALNSCRILRTLTHISVRQVWWMDPTSVPCLFNHRSRSGEVRNFTLLGSQDWFEGVWEHKLIAQTGWEEATHRKKQLWSRGKKCASCYVRLSWY